MKPILAFLFISSLALADTTRNLEAEAKAVIADPAFVKSKVIGTWTAQSDTKATLILELDGTFQIIKEKDQIAGTWIGGKDRQIVLRFKSIDTADHFTILKIVDDKLVDDQVDYKVFYSRK